MEDAYSKPMIQASSLEMVGATRIVRMLGLRNTVDIAILKSRCELGALEAGLAQSVSSNDGP